MSTPLVSICIPTYNRSRYLDSLLFSLTEHLAGFPYPFEVLVGDNASTDDTSDTVARFSSLLPLRYFRHDTNLGGPANWQALVAQASGKYLVYVADDDGLLGAEMARVIQQLEANPDVGVAYAPWKLLDLVADQDHGQFYTQDRDILVPRGQYRQLLDTLLRYEIFPEISIFRRDLLASVLPRVNEQAFYAFVHSAEFLQRTGVLFLKDPYYVSVTNYFADHQRNQTGMEEAETAWDRYRGGLEYVLGRAAEQVSEMERVGFFLRIQDMIARRISVAISQRLSKRRDPIETYYLAYRLKAMGKQGLLPLPMEDLRAQAAVAFLLTDAELNRAKRELVCLGHYETDLRRFIETRATIPVRFVERPEQLRNTDAQSLLFGRGAITENTLPQRGQGHFVHESLLLQKFAL